MKDKPMRQTVASVLAEIEEKYNRALLLAALEKARRAYDVLFALRLLEAGAYVVVGLFIIWCLYA